MRHHAPSHRNHLALCCIPIAADHGLHGGGSDVVRRRNLQRQRFAVAEVEGFHEVLLIGVSEVAIAHKANRLSPSALASARDGHLLLYEMAIWEAQIYL